MCSEMAGHNISACIHDYARTSSPKTVYLANTANVILKLAMLTKNTFQYLPVGFKIGPKTYAGERNNGFSLYLISFVSVALKMQ